MSFQAKEQTSPEDLKSIDSSKRKCCNC